MDDDDLLVYPLKFRSWEFDPEPREDFWDGDLQPRLSSDQPVPEIL